MNILSYSSTPPNKENDTTSVPVTQESQHVGRESKGKEKKASASVVQDLQWSTEKDWMKLLIEWMEQKEQKEL